MRTWEQAPSTIQSYPEVCEEFRLLFNLYDDHANNKLLDFGLSCPFSGCPGGEFVR